LTCGVPRAMAVAADAVAYRAFTDARADDPGARAAGLLKTRPPSPAFGLSRAYFDNISTRATDVQLAARPRFSAELAVDWRSSETGRFFRIRPVSVPVSNGRYGRAIPPRRLVVSTTPAMPAASRAVMPAPSPNDDHSTPSPADNAVGSVTVPGYLVTALSPVSPAC
jgi:hypothetical protein